MTNQENPPSEIPEDLTKVTVYLTPETMRALDEAACANGDSRTDTINRSIQAYRVLMEMLRDGAVVHVKKDGTGFRLYVD